MESSECLDAKIIAYIQIAILDHQHPEHGLLRMLEWLCELALEAKTSYMIGADKHEQSLK